MERQRTVMQSPVLVVVSQNFLEIHILSLTFTVDEKTILYKPPAEVGPTKSAWGTRCKLTSTIRKIRSWNRKEPQLTRLAANFMANGRDFWVELSKQVKALEEEQKKSKQ